MKKKIYTKRKHRLLSFVLCAVMLITFIPVKQVVVQAEEEISQENSLDEEEISQEMLLDEEEKEESVTAESLMISEEEIRLSVNEGNIQYQLNVTILPEDTKEEKITWTSSNEMIATVDETGMVTAVSNGMTMIRAEGAGCQDSCLVYVGTPVFFVTEQDGITIKVSGAEDAVVVYDYNELLEEQKDLETENDTEAPSIGKTENKYVTFLNPGSYSYIATGDAYYASVCAFTVTENGTVKFRTDWSAEILSEYRMYDLLDTETGTFAIQLDEFVRSTNPGAWDGTTIDVSWFEPGKTEFNITNAEEFAGLAAIVNGIYNAEINVIKDDGMSFTPEEYEKYESAKIKIGCSTKNTGGPNGLNEVTSTDFYFNEFGYDFDGMTVYLEADLDMGGYQKSDGSWSGARYMPIGGQYQMHYVKNGIADGFSHLGSSFNGTFDGQGHVIYNIYCDRYSVTSYGDSSTIGLFGRLGIHDSDYDAWKKYGDIGGNYPAVNPTIRNVAVDGFIYGRRSIGGIVGKIGKTTAVLFNDGSIGGIIENCINYAEVNNTDAKGCGGIVGTAWNAGVIRNCVNFGTITSTYDCPTAGIAGSNEISIVNCYNVGNIKAKSNTYAMAIGTNNGGGTDIRNCYWLTNTASGGGYYRWKSADVTEIIDGYNGTLFSAFEYLKTEVFLDEIRGNSRDWSNIYQQDTLIYGYMAEINAVGMPVPNVFAQEDTEKIISYEVELDTIKTVYVEGERVDTSDLEIWAVWSDGTKELVEEFVVKLDGENLNRTLVLEDNGKELTVTAGSGKNVWKKTYKISVEEVQVKSIQSKSAPDRYNYNEGEKFDPTGMSVRINYSNGKYVDVSYQKDGFQDAAGNIYDIETRPAAGTELTYEKWNDRMIGISYEFKNVTHSITTGVSITVVSTKDKPKQDENGVYLVSTEKELQWLAQQINTGIDTKPAIKLVNDIEMKEPFTPLGNATYKYQGTFDGGTHKVVINCQLKNDVAGFFGYIQNAEICNLITAGNVDGYYAGGVVGAAYDSTIENCGNEANLQGYTVASGIVGYIGHSLNADGEGTKISGCYNIGTIESVEGAAGIVGMSENVKCTITNCYNWGMISGAGTNMIRSTGGIIGTGYAQTDISNVYNAGIVNTKYENAKYVGAIGGYINKALGENCYWLSGRGVAVVATAPEAVKLTLDEGRMINTQELSRQVLAIGTDIFAVNPDNGTALKKDCIPVLAWQEPTGHNIEDGKCMYCGEGAYVMGDLNGDGEVDILDMVLIERCVTKDINETTIDTKAADVNGDGEIDILDMVLIERYVAKDIEGFN